MSGSTARRGVVTTLLVGALVTGVNVPSASADVTAVGGGAFGVSARLAVPPGGPNVVVPPYPEVTLPADGGWEENAAAAPDWIVVAADLLRVLSFGGSGRPESGQAVSSAQANNVFTLQRPGIPSVTATQIASECASNHNSFSGESGSSGSASLVEADVLGTPLPAAPEPNTVIDVAPGVKLHLNEQIVRNEPGAETSITVNALRMSIDIPMVARGEVIVSQSRCSVFGPGVLVPPAP